MFVNQNSCVEMQNGDRYIRFSLPKYFKKCEIINRLLIFVKWSLKHFLLYEFTLYNETHK